MPRLTRSGVQFSPYELLNLPTTLRPFQVIRTNISLDALLHDAVADDDRAAAEQDAANSAAEDEWEDLDDVPLKSALPPTSSLPPTPPSPLTPLSPSSSACPSPHPSPPPSPGPSSHGPSVSVKKSSRQAAGRPAPSSEATAPIANNRPIRSTSISLKPQPPPGRGSLSTLPELLDEGGEVVEWNGRDPKLILDAEGRIIAILLGTPEDDEWPAVIEDAVAAMKRARRETIQSGEWRVGTIHRRGTHLPLRGGASFGGGQKKPGNLCHTPFMRRLIRRLLRNKSIRRIAGFQSMGLALYAPKLYQYYCKVLRGLFQKHPNLIHTFSNSVFPAVTLNCGDAVTFEHCDIFNIVHGLCPITSGGHFNHVLGGHLYLRQLRLIIQFPSGATILIPSGCLDHGNTPIQTGETRYSITQYAAGGLFRWAAYGYQSGKSLLAQTGRGGREERV
ncbi:hypothetical protein C8F04DRAFT_1264702 [Mycena alexandri]|uniref:Uncharacterized protein n=1 Tax=Mycena alexandri TaxID=1745969 RepID=A0AAD6SPU9_9AGAR|nr:hypothetical protein C8F04DRAFT_1264702 [Mycena alexandri]